MKRTSSKAANNAKYCMKYRNKNIETIREKDKERKRFEREYEKYCDEEKYEEKKRKNRERKRLAKERKLEEMEESSVIPNASENTEETPGPSSSSSSVKGRRPYSTCHA